LWIRKAKGKKNRIVMLVTDLQPRIAASLASWRGKTYLFEERIPEALDNLRLFLYPNLIIEEEQC